MRTTTKGFDGLQALVMGIGFIILLMFAPTVYFAIKGDQTGFAVSIAVLAMLFLGFMVMGAVALGAEYTRRTMRDGAELALAAQESDDRRDAQEFGIAARLFTAGARTAQGLRAPDHMPLPLPSQGLDWLPPVEMLDSGDGWEPND